MEQVEKSLDLISPLSETEIATLKDALEVLPSSKEAKCIGNIKVKKHPDIDCPHCACNLIKGHGQYKGRKRYRCCFCSKTFTELTDTPISNTKYPEKWNDFVKCSIDGLSLRKTAERLGIHVATAFKWRHKLMGAYVSNQKLTGMAEADETFFLHSEKGTNYVAIKIGELFDIDKYAFSHPSLKNDFAGKLFLKQEMELTGTEISFNKMLPGESMPFCHKHRMNEEVFVFIKGNGQFQIDSRILEIEEGSVIKIDPNGERSLRNNSSKELIFIVIQAKAGSFSGETISDGVGLAKKVTWDN